MLERALGGQGGLASKAGCRGPGVCGKPNFVLVVSRQSPATRRFGGCTAAPAIQMAASGTELLPAILQTLSEKGPSPTLFRASPAASLYCEGRELRCAAGWWLVFACDLEVSIVYEETLYEGPPLEVAVLRFTPAGPELNAGEPWSWELSLQVRNGARRLVLRDLGRYLDTGVLAMYAIGQCRDALLRGAAVRLGTAYPEPQFSFAAVSRSLGTFASMLPPRPWLRPAESAESSAAPEAPTGGAPLQSGSPLLAPLRSGSPPPPPHAIQHVQLPAQPPLAPLAALSIMDETPRADAAEAAALGLRHHAAAAQGGASAYQHLPLPAAGARLQRGGSATAATSWAEGTAAAADAAAAELKTLADATSSTSRRSGSRSTRSSRRGSRGTHTQRT